MTPALLPRMMTDVVRSSLAAFRVVIVNGPRQAGKSTLLQNIGLPGEYVSLDDRQLLRAARTDPAGFLEAYRRPLIIDEVQRGGQPLVLAVKSAVDRAHTEPGQFVLAGSSRFLTVPQISESLAGRARLIDLWPLGQAEFAGRIPATTMLDHLFGEAATLRRLDCEPVTRRDVAERIVRGGFPALTRLDDAGLREAWLDDYVTTMIQRDITELSRIRHARDVPTLLRLLAARTAQELNVAAVARQAQLSEDTVRSYLALLETIYLIHVVPAWAPSFTTRVKRRPKLHVVDSGVAANLLGQSVEQLLRPPAPAVGQLAETFVANELLKLQGIATVRTRLFHYRDREGREVDLVLEARDGRIAAVEVKAAIDVDESDFRHLVYLRDRLGDRFVNGVVLHAGSRPLPFGDRLTALPVSALWADTVTP